jgi:hypothetical protein
MIRRLLTAIAIVAVLGASLAVPASAHSAARSTPEAPKAEAGILAISHFSCSLYPTVEVTCGGGTTTTAYSNIRVRYTWKRYNHAIRVKAVRCGGGDLGPWVQLTVKYHIYTLVSSIGNGVCFRLKWGRSWASGVNGDVYY